MFDELIRQSFQFNQEAYDSDPHWALLRELFEKNFENPPESFLPLIPKIIHQVWLGGGMPVKYQYWASTWQYFNPDWEYHLWDDSAVAMMDLPNRALFDSMTNYGPKSDLLRYEILRKYGGLYVDTDFECLKPFDDLTYLNFFTGVGYPSKLELYPGLIGCTKNHPIMARAVEAVCDIKSMPTSSQGVLETISSYFFTRIFFQVVKEYTEGIVALPPDYLYPFPNQQGHAMRNGKDYVKECSFAIHHWEVSWLKR
jgi:inositol phosphorylceramide mannosyltransferase catalytic subunit